MRLKYENYSLRCILFQTLKQHSEEKNLIAKTFYGTIAKMKAASPVQVIKNKKKCFQLCLDWTNTLVFTIHFLRAQSKSWAPRKKFAHPCKSFFFQRCILDCQASNKQFLAKTSQIINGWVLNTPLYFEMYRSSRSQMFFEIDVLKIFTIFTEKQMCWSLFLLKLQAFRPEIIFKRDSNTGVFL